MDSDLATPATMRQRVAALAGLLAVAAALRLASAHFLPNMIWADEIY